MMSNREFRKPGILHAAWLKFEKLLNGITGPDNNPFYYLGAISVFFLWIILVTGVYLFFFYSITARGAYQSVESLTVNQWYLGGVMRSLHRYASDGLVVAMVLHALRCYVLDRFKYWRWLPWVSGVVMAWVIWIGGVFGYWMVWDERGKFAAVFSARMLENIPIFGLPLSLNFALMQNLTDQLFYIVLFIHFSTIFFLFILIMIHIMRITKSVINPPKTMVYGLLVTLFAMSFAMPARSTAPADLMVLPRVIPLDWLYMFFFPLLKYMSEHALWLFIAAATLIASIVPWLTRKKRSPAVELTLENCTGCELCMEDCPYQAIQMRKRTDGMPYPVEAVISPNRCASCGICMGACDYKALNLPDMTEEAVKARIKAYAKELKETGPDGALVMVFVCAKGAWVNGRIGANAGKGFEWARVVNVQCIGMLQPSMISLPFEQGLDGVFVAGCREGDCHFRRGNEWLSGRVAGARPPVLKRSVDKTRLGYVQLSAVEGAEFLDGLKRFKEGLMKRSA